MSRFKSTCASRACIALAAVAAFSQPAVAQTGSYSQSFGDRLIAGDTSFVVNAQGANQSIRVESSFASIRTYADNRNQYIRSRACSSASGVKTCSAYSASFVMPASAVKNPVYGPYTFVNDASFPTSSKITVEWDYGRATSSGTIDWSTSVATPADLFGVSVTVFC
jgi:hypothetical protein